MVKTKRRYVCQACGSVSHRWQGQCADCAEWNTLVEDAPASVFSLKHDLSSGGRAVAFEALDAPSEPLVRLPTGLAEFDRALGGGLVPGSAMLMGGDPGIGKSTLLLQSAGAVAQARACRWSMSAARKRPARCGCAPRGSGWPTRRSSSPRRPACATSSPASARCAPPALLVIDSIQTMHSDTIEGAPGTVSQVRGCAFELIRYAKENGVALVLVGHVTKDGSIAGPRVLEHMVDVVMSFEGERSHQYRILRALKNRFGAVDEIGVFAMAGAGLEEVANPSLLFLSGREEPLAGSAVFPGARRHAAGAGRNPGADRASCSRARPRAARWWGGTAGGWRCCWRCSNRAAGSISRSAEVYLNVAGGYRLSDPAADLAVAAALVSALADKPLATHAVWFGEVSLAGEIRPVAHAGLRLREAAKLGFGTGYGPADVEPGSSGLNYRGLRRLANLVDRVMAGA